MDQSILKVIYLTSKTEALRQMHRCVATTCTFLENEMCLDYKSRGSVNEQAQGVRHCPGYEKFQHITHVWVAQHIEA